jgi:hypothetical protein
VCCVRRIRALPRRVKINAPEVGRGRQKFHSHAYPFGPALAGKYDAALLLFLRLRIYQHQHLVVIHLMPQHKQPAMRVHHQGFAYFAKLLPGVAAAQCLQLHPVEYTLAAPVCGKGGFLHSVPIIGLAPGSVNCPFGQVFPIAKLFAPANL